MGFDKLSGVSSFVDGGFSVTRFNNTVIAVATDGNNLPAQLVHTSKPVTHARKERKSIILNTKLKYIIKTEQKR